MHLLSESEKEKRERERFLGQAAPIKWVSKADAVSMFPPCQGEPAVLNIVHMTFAKVYQFKGLTFEHHDYLGPTMLRRKTHKDRDYRAIKGRQWGLYSQWLKLPTEQREQFRIA